MAAIELRPATAADSEFGYRLHSAAMGEYVAAVWGWDECRQRPLHAQAFNPGRWQVITHAGVDIGMIDVEHRPEEVYLARIEILPRYQGRGIGWQLIGALIDESSRAGKALVLDVLAVNQRARGLYERLGMKEVARHGKGGMKITMRSTPPASSVTGPRPGSGRLG